MKEFEKISETEVSKEEKVSILLELTKAEAFNYFLNDKLKTSKRFGVEGVDTLISGLSKPSPIQTNSHKKPRSTE